MPATLSVADHLALLRREGVRLAQVAAGVPLAAAVPGCPGWDVEALLGHLGDVHRWAERVVRERVQDRLRADFQPPAGREALLAWFDDGHCALLETLSTTSPADRFWSWGTAPSPLAFWARRQAHETAVHRLDAEQAAGEDARFDDPAAAADGIDEWLMLAAESYHRPVPDGKSRILAVEATDTGDRWAAILDPTGLRLAPPAVPADCTVSARAGEVFALLMNRRDAEGLSVSGDATVLRAWREGVHF